VRRLPHQRFAALHPPRFAFEADRTDGGRVPSDFPER
jgi:hypothetical protein